MDMMGDLPLLYDQGGEQHRHTQKKQLTDSGALTVVKCLKSFVDPNEYRDDEYNESEQWDDGYNIGGKNVLTLSFFHRNIMFYISMETHPDLYKICTVHNLTDDWMEWKAEDWEFEFLLTANSHPGLSKFVMLAAVKLMEAHILAKKMRKLINKMTVSENTTIDDEFNITLSVNAQPNGFLKRMWTGVKWIQFNIKFGPHMPISIIYNSEEFEQSTKFDEFLKKINQPLKAQAPDGFEHHSKCGSNDYRLEAALERLVNLMLHRNAL